MIDTPEQLIRLLLYTTQKARRRKASAAAREVIKLKAKKGKAKDKATQVAESSNEQSASVVLSDSEIIDQLRRMVRGELVCSDETSE